MVRRKPLQKKRYIFALVVSLFLFSFGFLLGYWTVDAKINFVIDSSSDLKLDSLDFDVQKDFLDIYPCDFFSTKYLESNLAAMESDLKKIEASASPDNERLIYMKSYYSLLELKHWMFLSKFNEMCNQDYTFIFYFYSNNEYVCSDCVVQGYLLDKIREQYPNIKIYSFDASVEIPSVQMLREKYNITSLPSIVVNDKLYEGYASYDILVDIVKSQNVKIGRAHV